MDLKSSKPYKKQRAQNNHFMIDVEGVEDDSMDDDGPPVNNQSVWEKNAANYKDSSNSLKITFGTLGK